MSLRFVVSFGIWVWMIVSLIGKPPPRVSAAPLSTWPFWWFDALVVAARDVLGDPSVEYGAGSIQIFYGDETGLQASNDQLWDQNTPGLAGVVEANDGFGRALSGGDFNGDGFPDLAVGVPGESFDGADFGGLVQVIYGGNSGLVASDSEVWHQNLSDLVGATETGDGFGSALASCDFDGNGYDDLAVGIPGEDVGTIVNAGAVHVIYGFPWGLGGAGDLFLHQGLDGVTGLAEESDQFGEALACGDFNGDGYGDLVAAAYHEDVSGATNAGAVNVLYGSFIGLVFDGDQMWHQGVAGLIGVPEDGDSFGYAVATGDFNGDGYDDLAVGVPFEDIEGKRDAGVVQVIYGSADGLRAAGSQVWYQGVGIEGAAEVDDRFGQALAAGDFNGDGFDDLAIGTPFERIGSAYAAGAVQVIYGSRFGLQAAGNQLWTQDSPNVPDSVEPGDMFGASLASGDFNHDGFDELVIGIPGENISSHPNAGMVLVLFGSITGLQGSESQAWHRDAPGVEGQAADWDEFGIALTTLSTPWRKTYLPRQILP